MPRRARVRRRAGCNFVCSNSKCEGLRVVNATKIIERYVEHRRVPSTDEHRARLREAVELAERHYAGAMKSMRSSIHQPEPCSESDAAVLGPLFDDIYTEIRALGDAARAGRALLERAG